MELASTFIASLVSTLQRKNMEMAKTTGVIIIDTMTTLRYDATQWCFFNALLTTGSSLFVAEFLPELSYNSVTTIGFSLLATSSVLYFSFIDSVFPVF